MDQDIVFDYLGHQYAHLVHTKPKSSCPEKLQYQNPLDFWDWSWQEFALFDLPKMMRYVYSTTSSIVFVVGHSQILHLFIYFTSPFLAGTFGVCCFNNSRVDFYLYYGPHSTSTKNLHNLFQMPLLMAYGGNDDLVDVTDFHHTLKELQSTPELLYLENYGHIDFIVSLKAK
ncbi:unnamed protein product [Malus baccata var. baccata]